MYACIYVWIYVQYKLMTYLVLRLYVCPPIQEDGENGMVAIGSSQMEGGLSMLQQECTKVINSWIHDDKFMYYIYLYVLCAVR